MVNRSKVTLAGLVISMLMISVVAIPLPPAFAEQTARPDATSSNTAWTVNGAGTAHEATDEASTNGDTDYISATSTTADITLSLGSITDPQSSSDHVVRVTARSVGGSGQPERITFILKQGSTTISSSGSTAVSGSGYTELTDTLTQGEADSITDYSDLSVQIQATTLGNGEEIRVTKVELGVPDAPASDTTAPTVTITVNDSKITEADVGSGTFQVIATFSEAMDTGVTPTVAFSPSVSTTLTFASGAWSSGNTVYTATYNVTDANVSENNVSVSVSGAKDVAGNTQSPNPTTIANNNRFDIDTDAAGGGGGGGDTTAPTVTITVNDAEITGDDVGSGTFQVIAKFSEAMDTGVTPTITFSPDVSSTLTFASGAWSKGNKVYTATYNVADANVAVNDVDVSVSGAKDTAGNTQSPNPTTTADLFDIDTEAEGSGSGPVQSHNAKSSGKQKGSEGNPGKIESNNNDLGNPEKGKKKEIDFTATENDQKDVIPNGLLKKLDLVLAIDLSSNTDPLIISVDLLEDEPADVPDAPLVATGLFLDIDVSGADLSSASSFQESPKIDFLIDADLEADARYSDGCPQVQIYFLNEATGTWVLVDEEAERDPATDVVDPDKGLQCEYIGELPHFSKFSVGGAKKPTSGGGDSTAYEIVDTVEPTIIDYNWTPTTPSAGGSITVNAKISDNVGIKASYVFYQLPGEDDMRSVTMKESTGLFTADIPARDVSMPGLSFWVIAQDFAENAAMTDEVAVEIGAAVSTSEAKTSRGGTPDTGKAKPTAPAERLEVTALRDGSTVKSFREMIIIKNLTDQPMDNIRITLSSSISKSFRLSDYAIRHIEPNGSVTVVFELTGKPNTDMVGELTPYKGEIMVISENHSPISLPVRIGTAGYMDLDKSYMNLMANSAAKRYSKLWLINSMLGERPEVGKNYDVRTSDGDTVISSASDELVIKNISQKTLKGIKIIPKGGYPLLPEQSIIPILEPNSQVSIKLISKFDNTKSSPKNIRAELLIVPANDRPFVVSIDIPAHEQKDSADEFAATLLSGSDTIRSATDTIQISNTGARSLDSMRVVLTNDLSKIFSLSETAFGRVAPGEEVAVEMKYSAKDLKTFMQGYNGELRIASEHHNTKTIQVSIAWNRVSSEHFTVYARNGDEAAATHVLDTLESKYQEITERFGEVKGDAMTEVYITTSMDEMRLVNPSGSPYYSVVNDAVFVCACEDPDASALKMFVYRVMINNLTAYHNMKKFVADGENWLFDGMAAYMAATMTDSGTAGKYLTAFTVNRAGLEWYGHGSPAQYGAAFTFMVFLEDKYGSGIIETTVDNLSHGMTSNNKCSTIEECAVVRAAYSEGSLDWKKKKFDLDFDDLVAEWKSFVDKYDPAKINAFQKAEIEKALAKQKAGLELTPMESAVLNMAKIVQYML